MKFLMISRLLYDKGYQQFVDTAATIKKSFPEVEFLIAGDVDTKNNNHVSMDIIRKDEEKGFINYLGYNNNIQSIIKEVDCIVHPTFYNEGLSRVLMEALAMSKPIITTDIPGCRETVIDGLNGFLCKPKDSSSLTETILKFLALTQPQRETMGKEGRKLAEQRFDIKNVIKIYEQILSQTI